MAFYVAQFLPDSEHPDVYTVTFPDLPGCITQGDNLAEAFDMAQEALKCHLDGMVADKDAIPEASNLQEAILKAKKEAEEYGDELPEGTLYQLIATPDLFIPPVRVNISLAPQVLELVDRFAKAEGMSRSGFLTNAARAYIRELRA